MFSSRRLVQEGKNPNEAAVQALSLARAEVYKEPWWLDGLMAKYGLIDMTWWQSFGDIAKVQRIE